MKFSRKPEAPPSRRRPVDSQTPARSDLSSFAYSSSRQTSQASNRQPQQPKHFKAIDFSHARDFWLQRLGLLILLVAIVVSCINILSLSSNAQIVTIKDGATVNYFQSNQTYAAAAKQYLGSSVWNHSKITVNANGLEMHLQKQFPELTHVSVSLPLIAHRPIIYLQSTRPGLVLNTTNGSFILDDSGKALSKSTSAATPDNLPSLTDMSGLPAHLNQQVLPASYISYVQTVIAELAAKQYTVSAMSLPAASSELDVHLTGQPYYVKFNLQDNNPAGEAGTFLATINNLKKQNITPAQYVDVRLPGRAYYQ